MRDIIAKTQLFSQLDEQSLTEIASASSLKKVDRQEMIFYEGDPAGAFFIVSTGKVKVFKMSPDGKEQILTIANPGDSFAEAALFAGGKYPASAQALEDSELVMIERGRFVSVLGKNPDVAVNMIARMAGLLRKMTSLVEELSLTDVTTRLAHYLASHIEAADRPTVITLPEKKAVLAAQLGTIPETLSRSFARLTKEKVIAIDGPRIRVLDPKRLRELAGGEWE